MMYFNIKNLSQKLFLDYLVPNYKIISLFGDVLYMIQQLLVIIYSYLHNEHMKEENSAAKRTVSLAEKKDIMWNIIQPGDPYDIRKSMIATLPGQRKFMGPHLELVCLLQAAEIERLCLYLEQHKVKLRESERLELDRHSYEVQIKELTEKLASYQNYKLQSERLKEHIRKLTIELEQLQKQSNQNNMDLSKKYESSLRQIQILIKEKEQLNDANVKLGNQLNSIKQLYKVNQQAKAKQFQTLTKEIGRMNDQQLEQDQRYRENFRKWDFQRKRLETELTNLSKRYEDLQQNIKQVQKTNLSLKMQLERAKYQAAKAEQYRKTFKQYQDRFVKVAQEIDRLNEVLKDKTRLLNQQYLRTKQLSERNRAYEQEISEKDQKISQLERANSVLLRQQREALASLNNMEQNKVIIKSYEASLQKFSIEVERLSNILLKKNAENEEFKNKISEYEAKIWNLERNQRSNKEQIQRYGEITTRLTLFQNDNNRLSEEIDRLKQTISHLLQEKNTLQFKNQSYENQFKKLHNTISTLSSQIQKEKMVKQSEVEGNYIPQIERLNNIISRQKQINLQNQEKIGYLQRQVKNLEEKFKSRQDPSNYFRNIYDSSEELKGNIATQQNKEEYITDLKKRIKMLQLELKYVEAAPIQTNKTDQKTGKQGQKQPQAFKTPQEQIQKLKDQLLGKEIQNNRLAQINEQLREMVHQYKKRIAPTPYETGSPSVPGFTSQSPQDTKAFTNKAKQEIRPRPWDIQQEQQIKIIRQQSPGFKQETQKPKAQDYSTGQREGSGVRSKYTRPVQRQKDSPYKTVDYPYQRSPQLREQPITYGSRKLSERPEESQKGSLQMQIIPDPLVFKKALGEIQQIKEPTVLAANLKSNYQQLLSSFQNLAKSHNRLKSKLRNYRQSNELSQNYINELTGKIEVLNDQIRQLKQHIDPKLYLQNQEGTLQKSYSLLLQKYNNAVFDNDALRSKIKNINSLSPQAGSSYSNDDEIRRLQAQNQSLRSKCATFSQYYNKIKMVNDELERLNKILLQKDKELKQKDTLIRDYQIQQLNYQGQIRQMNTKFRDLPGFSEISLPLTLESGSNNLDREILRLQNRNAQLQKIIKGYQLEQPIVISGPQQQKRKIQKKFQAMNTQIVRLNNLLSNKKKDIEVLQEKNKSLSRVAQDNKKFTSSTADNRNILAKYESKMALLSQEVQRLNELMIYKNQNYQALKRKFDDYQLEVKRKLQENAAEVDRLNQLVSVLRGDVQRPGSSSERPLDKNNGKPQQAQNLTQYEAKLLQLSNQIIRLNKLLTANKQKMDDYEDRISKYRSEIERLNNSLRLKVQESIMSVNKEKAFAQQKRILTRQIQEKIKEYQQLSEKFQIVQQENAKFNQHLNSYQTRVKGLYEELERLQRIISILKRENPDIDADSLNDLYEKNRYLIGEIERLNTIVTRQNQDLSDLRLNLTDQTSLQKRINEDLALFVVLFAQIQSLRIRVRDQEIELQQVRRLSVIARKA